MKKTIRICPRCKSENWKIPLSSPGSANPDILECSDCGYVGIFLTATSKNKKETESKK